MTRLQHALARLASERRDFMARVEGASAQQLAARLRPEKWSVLEIAEHVVVAERVVLRGLPDSTQMVDVSPRSALKRILVTAVLRLGIPVEAPSRKMLPTGTRDVAELRQMWDEAESWLRAVANRNDLHRAFFRHPVAGGLTLAEAIALDRVHIARHRRQIEKTLRRSQTL